MELILCLESGHKLFHGYLCTKLIQSVLLQTPECIFLICSTDIISFLYNTRQYVTM